MRAIILAAGRGSRMKCLTDERPKCLVELNGRALLDWQLEAIRGAGINEIAIVTGYNREMLADRGTVEFHNPRWTETQMVSSLTCAEKWLMEDICIISYSDIFYDIHAVKLLMECAASLAITYDPNWVDLWRKRFGDPLLDAETFRLNPDNTLAEIGSKPQSIEEVQGQYMGLLRFTPEGWKEAKRYYQSLLANAQDSLHMTGMLSGLIKKNIAISAISYDGRWGEIDNQNDLSVYEQS
jgi:L-glutamine-phosphate cytidylyltransferase